MKHLITKMLILIATLSASLSASGYDFEVDGFYYNITDQAANEVAVTYKTTPFNSYTGVVNIPSTVSYNGTTYTVTSIGSSAFEECGDLISVTIPNSVKNIGYRAFYECKNLNSITIGSGVTTIGDYAFSYEYDTERFRGIYRIPKVIWLGNTPPTGVNNISANMNYVSNNQFKLSNQTVYPFLSSRFEVDGVIYVPISPSERTCDVIDCNYDPTNTEITISNYVVNKNVELKVLNVNNYAFYCKSKITKLEISNDGYIGEYAFYNCDALTSVVASNNGYIGESAFYNCEALTSVVARNNGYIGYRAFYGCDNLKTLEAFNKGYIENEAFRNCYSLETANIDIIGSIGEYGFYDCKNLKFVNLGSNITDIKDYAFSGNTSLETMVIPNNISSLGTYAFSGCSSLQDVSIGRGITKLPNSIFYNCGALHSIVIPNTINLIGDNTFNGCSNLSNVTFEEDNTPTYAQDWTSSNHAHSSSSSRIYNISVMTGDVLSFEIWSDREATNDKLTVYLNNTSIAKISGLNQTQSITESFSSPQTVTLTVTYSKDGSESSGTDRAGIRNIKLNGKPAIVSNTIVLGSNGSSPLFGSCKLDEVFIGRKLSYKTSEEYGYSPFYRNSSLRKVTITDSETQIYDNEFYGCSNLQEFSCGDGVTTIGNWAFSGCSSLKSFVSGTKVESIGQEAFSDCTAMTSFTSNANVPPTCGTQALDDINKWECTLFVPQESVDDYQGAPQWKEFFFIEESGVEDVLIDNDDTTSYPIGIYNLHGIKIGNSTENLAPSLYIKRQGKKTEKIIIK